MKAGDWVDVTSLYVGEAGVEVQQRRAGRFLLVEYDIPRGCVASYYPETNPLVRSRASPSTPAAEQRCPRKLTGRCIRRVWPLDGPRKKLPRP